MSQSWSTYTTTIAQNLGDPSLVNDANFQQMVPAMIDDAEQRICREVDFLGAVVNTGTTTAPGSRLINWSNSFFVVESVNAITPAGTTNPDLGTRNPVLPASREVCNYLYPSQTNSGVPQYFGRVTQSTAVLAPYPDQAYTLEITGTQRPTPLSATNTTTFISTYLPDLFIAASMIYAEGYQQNFGAMADNPASSVNWSSHYQELLASAQIEEARKRFESEGWSSKSPSKIATPPRT
jgi:hypothetical protein